MVKHKATGKIHKLRIASVIALAISGFWAVMGFAMLTQVSSPLLFLGEITLGIAGLSGLVGLGTLTGYVIEKIRIRHYRKISSKNLQKIAEADRDPSIVLSDEKKISIIKKYSNANLKLAKINGCPFVGRFACVAGLSPKNSKENEAFNVAENLSIQKSISTKPKKAESIQKKYSKKIRIASKTSTDSSTMYPWTMIYKNFKKGVEIIDRRIEINCLTSTTCEKFKKMAQEMPITPEIGGFIQVKLGKDKEKQTYIRVADVNYLDKAKELLIEDILLACEENEQIKESIFPISIHKIVFDKNAKYDSGSFSDNSNSFISYQSLVAKYKQQDKTK